ncbi:hypothetical protein [Metabacillus bambusae]|uniref:Phage tail protein n=1 Tax=Metabacillus bambusae TaxID=2795218 RepID=A0ABS3N5T3_9BACI|nr:hypothetical protein [Metabacillus bambusae]MBO1513233.1 hypothetical protein [Metabacillus bambusae]
MLNKETLEYIVGLGTIDIYEENGQQYSTSPLYLLEEPRAAHINIHSLSGLVEYLKSNFDGECNLMVHVESPTEVTVFSNLNNDRKREYLIKATAMLPSFRYENWYDPETFNIKLQSGFVKNDDRDVVLKVVGNIKEEDVKTYGDNGVSQSVTAKVGVATVGQVEVPNPVSLAPYRTFVEVEQPTSNFVFRMKNGPASALFEADGGAWKLEAMKNIKSYLQDELVQELEVGKITIIA